ncbi:hypothetical protein [Paenibacillus sp. MMO-177]|uniref:hypothetical protein n=1 Tax=Paenibacillus sp. MMO-177 TaxID=3081289 RepID=UPI003015E396
MEVIKNLDGLQSHKGIKFRRDLAILIAVCVFILILFIGITLTSQNDSQGKELYPPEIEFPLAEYTMFMSGVPGFPIKVSNIEATRIIVHSSDGNLLFWKSSNGKMNSQGKKAEIKPGETMYWSPLTGANKVQYKTIIKFTAFKGNKKLGKTSIEISSDDNFIFRGKLVEE